MAIRVEGAPDRVVFVFAVAEPERPLTVRVNLQPERVGPVLLIISEAIQNAMVGTSYSVTNALALIVTLVVIDMGLNFVKMRLPRVERWLEGAPLVVVKDGRPLDDRLRWAGIDVSDVLRAARSSHGLERLEQVKYAVLERNGDLSIIPHERGAAPGQDRAAARCAQPATISHSGHGRAGGARRRG